METLAYYLFFTIYIYTHLKNDYTYHISSAHNNGSRYFTYVYGTNSAFRFISLTGFSLQSLPVPVVPGANDLQ